MHFDQVTVFSFPRCQGFTSVPRRGGATLGMVRRHSALQRYTVAEHSLEQQHRRRLKLQERLREKKAKALTHKVSAFLLSISLHCLSMQQSSYFICCCGPSRSPTELPTSKTQTGSQQIKATTPTSSSVMLRWTAEASLSHTSPKRGRRFSRNQG